MMLARSPAGLALQRLLPWISTVSSKGHAFTALRLSDGTPFPAHTAAGDTRGHDSIPQTLVATLARPPSSLQEWLAVVRTSPNTYWPSLRQGGQLNSAHTLAVEGYTHSTPDLA